MSALTFLAVTYTALKVMLFSICTSLANVTFEGAISLTDIQASAFPVDLCNKYLAEGKGTYTRASGSRK
jgi:hypothetical protein